MTTKTVVNHSMKKMMMTTGLVLSMAAAYSQNYWVVETNGARRSVVKIYNSENKLVSESAVGRRIDINKKKERRMLAKMLKQHNTRENLMWSKR